MLTGTTSTKLKQGITLDEAAILSMKNGLFVQKFRPATTSNNQYQAVNIVKSKVVDNPEEYSIPCNFVSLPAFRHLLRMCTRRSMHVMIINNSRQSLKQTGEGHFSVVAAYDANTDNALFLDVAKYKYPPYWVKTSTLYNSMLDVDNVTSMQRGFMIASRRRNEPKAYVCNGFYDVAAMTEYKKLHKKLANEESGICKISVTSDLLSSDYILQGLMFAHYQYLKTGLYNDEIALCNLRMVSSTVNVVKPLLEVAYPHQHTLLDIFYSYLFLRTGHSTNTQLDILKHIFPI